MRRLGPDFQTLELAAQHAGSALACDFTSSAEYEAALIQERRNAGRYGSRERRQFFLAVGVGIAVVVVTLILV
jgi:hypothetical protein